MSERLGFSFLGTGQPAPQYLRAFAFCASFCSVNNKGGTVDLALKLNMLAVCTVFVFVGAVLLRHTARTGGRTNL